MEPIEKAAMIAASQHSVISTAQIRDLALPMRTVRRMVKTGQLNRLYPNVYRFAGHPLDWATRVSGAVIWGGNDATASYRCAARIHDLSIKSDVVEITIPRKARSPNGFIAHYGHIDPVDVRKMEGWPVTSVPRTLLMLGAVVPPALVERLFDEALVKGKTQTRHLLDVLMREGRRGVEGVAVFRRLLDQRISLPETVRSELERRMNRIFAEENLPPAVSQFKVTIGDQRLAIDFAYPALKIAIETDSNQFHLSRQDRERDTNRQNLLMLDGWLVVRFTWYMVTRQPKAVAEAIRAAIAARATG